MTPRGAARTGFAVFGVMVLACVVMRAWDPAADAGDPGLLYTNPLYRFGEFVLGILPAQLVAAGWRPRVSAGAALGAALAAWLALAVLVDRLGADPAAARFTHASSVRELGGLLLVPFVVLALGSTAAAELAGRLPRWLGSRVAVRLGRWSFAFSVVHQLVVCALAPALPTGTPGAQLLALAVVGTVSVLLAAVLHHGVEVPLARRWRTARPVGTMSPAGPTGVTHDDRTTA